MEIGEEEWMADVGAWRLRNWQMCGEDSILTCPSECSNRAKHHWWIPISSVWHSCSIEAPLIISERDWWILSTFLVTFLSHPNQHRNQSRCEDCLCKLGGLEECFRWMLQAIFNIFPDCHHSTIFVELSEDSFFIFLSSPPCANIYSIVRIKTESQWAAGFSTESGVWNEHPRYSGTFLWLSSGDFLICRLRRKTRKPIKETVSYWSIHELHSKR